MPTLVTPQRKIYRLSNKLELDAWADRWKINWRLRGNLAQLLGFDKVGSATDARKARHQAEGYFVLHEASWMFHADRNLVIPVFGSMSQKYASLVRQTRCTFSLATFKRLCTDHKKQSEDGWRCGQEPDAVRNLEDGACIEGLPTDSQQVSYPVPMPSNEHACL